MKTNPPGAIAEQMRATTDQLQRLQGELRRSLCENALDLRNVVDTETLGQFNTVVDDLRALTYPQVLAAEQPKSDDALLALQLHRMRRIREMLEAVQAEGAQELQPEMMLLLAEIERLVTRRTYVC